MLNLKTYTLKNRSKLIVIASIVLLLIGLINIYYVIDVRVTSNDECLWIEKKIAPDSTAIFFDIVKVNGVTWNAGIRDGDQLIAINNISIKTPTQAQIILNKVEAGDYALYTIKKGERIVKTEVYVKKLLNFPGLAAGLLGFIWMLIGFLVLMAKPDGTVQKLFYAIGVASILAMINILLPLEIIDFRTNQSHDLFYLFVAYLWSLGIAFLPFFIIYFFWTFPKPFRFLQKKWVQITILLIPALIFLTTFIQIILVFVYKVLDYRFFTAYARILGLIFTSANLIAWVSLIINYFKLKTKEEKIPIRYILVAFTIAIVASIYTARIAPVISDSVFNSPEYYTPIILIILLPIAFAYSIFRYQLMDVSVVIKNTITYGIATITVATIYFLIIYVLGQSISQAIGTQYQGIIAGFVFVLFALVFQSTKDKFNDFLTARFYPEQFAYQKVLIKFSNEVSTVVGLENILDSMKETFVGALKIKKFGILITDNNGTDISLVRNVGLNDDNLKLNANYLNKYINKRMITPRNPVINREDFPDAFPDNYSSLMRNEIYTIIPMIIKQKTAGLLLFGLKHSGSQFAGKDIDLLYAAANQAAISIENARLYESEAQKFKIEKDLDLARKIQQSLLPKTIPQMKGLDICGQMIPAMQVGGDYFDLIPISENELFVVVGDVSGKGLSASLYMTKLQTMVQSVCTSGKTPKEILIEVNKKLYTSMERNWFVTMTLALFNTEKSTVKFCRAGHVPLFIADNGAVNKYKTRGIGIGLESGIIFEETLVEEEVKLKSGQIYAFLSDGLTEAMDEYKALFGEDKMTDLLRGKKSLTSNELMNEIWKSIALFRGKAEQNDDMTMVLVKVV